MTVVLRDIKSLEAGGVLWSVSRAAGVNSRTKGDQSLSDTSLGVQNWAALFCSQNSVVKYCRTDLDPVAQECIVIDSPLRHL